MTQATRPADGEVVTERVAIETTRDPSAMGSDLYYDDDGDSVPTLARRLLDNATTLVRKELALATAEILESVHDVRMGVGGIASGGAVLYAGFIFLLLAAVFGLVQVMDPWAAALAVGGCVTVVGFIMLQAAKRKLKPSKLAPDRTVDSLNKDKDLIKGRAS